MHERELFSPRKRGKAMQESPAGRQLGYNRENSETYNMNPTP
jgi:hypothetical protein